MKDRNGREIEYGDVVVVEDGPHAGVVGMLEMEEEHGTVGVAPTLWAPHTNMVRVRLADTRCANDIERARWNRQTRRDARLATLAWLNKSPEGDTKGG